MVQGRKKTFTGLLHLSISSILPQFSPCLHCKLQQLYAGCSPALIRSVPLWRNSDSTHHLLRHQLLLPREKRDSLSDINSYPSPGLGNQHQLCSKRFLAQSGLHLLCDSCAGLAPTPALLWNVHDSTLAPTAFWLPASCPPALPLTHLCS